MLRRLEQTVILLSNGSEYITGSSSHHPSWLRPSWRGGKAGRLHPGEGDGERSAATASQRWSLMTFLPTGHHLFKSSTYPSSGLLETCSQVKAGSSPSCEFQDHCTLRSETSCVLWSLWCQSQFSAVPAKRLRKSSLSEWTESLLLFIHLSIHPSVYPSNHPISISQRAWLLGRQNISHAQCQASKRELTHVSCSLCVYVYICVCVCMLSHSVVSDSLWPYGR